MEELKRVLNKIEEEKKIIAEKRDSLREIFNELSDLLESFDRGIEGLENGKIEIENAIDSLSELV